MSTSRHTWLYVCVPVFQLGGTRELCMEVESSFSFKPPTFQETKDIWLGLKLSEMTKSSRHVAKLSRPAGAGRVKWGFSSDSVCFNFLNLASSSVECCWMKDEGPRGSNTSLKYVFYVLPGSIQISSDALTEKKTKQKNISSRFYWYVIYFQTFGC